MVLKVAGISMHLLGSAIAVHEVHKVDDGSRFTLKLVKEDRAWWVLREIFIHSWYRL